MTSDWVAAQEKRFANEPVIEEALANPIQRERIDQAVSFIGGPGLKVLDVGCGDGAISQLIHDKGNECWGMDLPGVVATVPEERTWLVRFECDASRAPWTTGKYDLPDQRVFPEFKSGPMLEHVPSDFFNVVFAGEIIEHMIDVDSFLNEAHRVLKPDGRLVLTTPNIVRELNRLGMLLGNVETWHEYKRIPHHVRYYTPKTLELTLKEHGFKPTKLSSGRSQGELGGYVEDMTWLSPAEKVLLRKLFDRTMPNPAWKQSIIVIEARKQ